MKHKEYGCSRRGDRRYLVSAFGILAIVVPTAVNAMSTKHESRLRPVCYRYDPEKSVVSGIVVHLQKYGPPNYGETPKLDSVVTVPVLKTDKAMRVCAKTGDGVNTEDYSNIQSIQIVTRHAFPRSFYGSRVKVTGSLFSAQSGHHYTPVLIWADSISRIPRATRIRP